MPPSLVTLGDLKSSFCGGLGLEHGDVARSCVLRFGWELRDWGREEKTG